MRTHQLEDDEAEGHDQGPPEPHEQIGRVAEGHHRRRLLPVLHRRHRSLYGPVHHMHRWLSDVLMSSQVLQATQQNGVGKPRDHGQVVGRGNEGGCRAGRLLAAAAVATVAGVAVVAVVAVVAGVAGVAGVRRVGLVVGWPRCSFCADFLLPFLPFFSLSFSSLQVSPTLFPSRTYSASCLAARQVLRRPLALRMCGPLSTRIHHALCHHVMCLFDTWHSSCTEFTSSSCLSWAPTSLSLSLAQFPLPEHSLLSHTSRALAPPALSSAPLAPPALSSPRPHSPPAPDTRKKTRNNTQVVAGMNSQIRISESSDSEQHNEANREAKREHTGQGNQEEKTNTRRGSWQIP